MISLNSRFYTLPVIIQPIAIVTGSQVRHFHQILYSFFQLSIRNTLISKTHIFGDFIRYCTYTNTMNRSWATINFQVIDLKGGIIAWTNKYGDTELEKSDSNGYIVFDGQQAPDFTVKLTDGKSVTLSEQRGKVVMLQFTASWCGVCRKEMPHIESDIWQAHKDNPDFVLIGIDRDEPLETVLKFGESTGITYPLGLDPGADIYAKYAVRESGITRNVLIDREGKLIQRTRLYDEKEFKSLVERINNELNK